MKKISWLKKLIIKSRMKKWRIEHWLKVQYWMAKIYIRKGVEVSMVPVEDEMSLYANDGTMYLECGEYDKAIKAYEKMIDLDPEYFDGYNMLGATYAEMGLKEQAKRYYKTALALGLKSNAAEEPDSAYRIDEEFIEEIREGLAKLEGVGDAKEV